MKVMERLQTCLETLQDNGGAPPFAFSVISADGSVFLGRYTGVWKDTEIGGPDESKPLHFPLFLTVVDHGGNAAVIRLTAEDTQVLYGG